MLLTELVRKMQDATPRGRIIQDPKVYAENEYEGYDVVGVHWDANYEGEGKGVVIIQLAG